MEESEARVHGDKQLSILLVEDDEVDAMAVKRAFLKSKIAYSITEARDGVEALVLLRDEKVPDPRIILLDINMPKMSGIEFLEEIRKDHKLKSSIVFILTTSKADEDKFAAYSFNIAGYIVKERVGNNFIHLVNMLKSYWKIVELPVGS